MSIEKIILKVSVEYEKSRREGCYREPDGS
jgi:hypothetical protein